MEALAPIVEEDVILACDHTPRTNWTRFARGEVLAALKDGTEVCADYIAICNECFALPMHELRVSVVRRPRREEVL